MFQDYVILEYSGRFKTCSNNMRIKSPFLHVFSILWNK